MDEAVSQKDPLRYSKSLLCRLPIYSTRGFSDELSAEEKLCLENCESVVDRGLQTFIEVGQALLTIRDKRLYLQKYQTFEDYCQSRLGLSSSRARQLIRASEVAANVESGTTVTLDNEAQARALAPYDQEVQKAVIQIAVRTAPKDDDENPILSAAHLKSVARVLTDVIKAGGMDDGRGVTRPVATLIDAAITEETYERLMRQKEYVKQAAERKASSAGHETNPRLSVYALELVTALVRGIEEWGSITEIPDCVKAPYLRGKAAIGETPTDLKYGIEKALVQSRKEKNQTN